MDPLRAAGDHGRLPAPANDGSAPPSLSEHAASQDGSHGGRQAHYHGHSQNRRHRQQHRHDNQLHHHHHHHHHHMVPPRGVDYATDSRRQLKELFDIYDRDGNGALAIPEVRELLMLLEGAPPTDEELRLLIARVMAKGQSDSGEILESLDFKGFVRFMEIVAADDNRPVTARQIFRAFDTDGNGKISGQELHDYAVSVGMDLSRSEADAMVHRAGKKGHITFEQFENGVFNLKSKLGKLDDQESLPTN